MRWLVVEEFKHVINSLPKLESVAVIGGTSNDPEVQKLKILFPALRISYFGIFNEFDDVNFRYFDLNSPGVIDETFSLVLCSQVLEHVHNLENCFKNLTNLVDKSGGFLWINCPCSNMSHGSPDFYSSGYSKDLIEQYLMRNSFASIKSGYLGSRRYHFMTHSLRCWATRQEHNHPVLGYKFKPGSALGILNKFRKEILWRFIATLFSKKVRTDLEYATEVFVLASHNKC
jgi:hypothetical protein